MHAFAFRSLLIGARASGVLALAASAPAVLADTPVFRDGRILLPIFVASDCGTDEREAAGELARVLEAMSGLPWPVEREDAEGRDGILIGHTRAAGRRLPKMVLASDCLAPREGEIGPDAFRIRTAGGCAFIEGATPEASFYAVEWLLMHEAGVRWYAPGPSGEVIPRRSEWSLPNLDVLREPAYLSRELSGFDSPEGAAWARRNGLRGRLEFRHALSPVFAPQLFAEHPDWFPILGGRRYRPSSVADRDWQPNLALPAVAEHASRAALEAFSREPSRSSFSLGINDTVRFDQGPETRHLVEPMRFFRGMPDYSPLVFTFMNRAAAAVSQVAPDRYLGCLAYFWCENPPPFPVNRNVVPFVTADRTQYYDRGFRGGDLELMSRWGASGARAFGLWEYAYGAGFVVPREPVFALADGIREGWRRGARGYLAEIGPNSGFDSFKAWAMAQLLWNQELTLPGLEDDFFHGYYGPAQAPMRQFFEACQAQWMGQGGTPFWLKYYGQEDQALLFPAGTCVRLRAMLTEAARLAVAEPACAARVNLASRAFAVTEAYVAFDSERRALAADWPDESAEITGGEGALSDAIGRLARARALLDSALGDRCLGGSKPAEQSLPGSLLRNDPVPRLLLCAGRRDPSAPRRILKAAGTEADRVSSWRAVADGIAAGVPTGPNLAVNSSFSETGAEGLEPHFLYPRFGALPAGWTLKAMPTEKGRATLVEESGSGGIGYHRRSIRIEGAWDTQIYQWLPAKPGLAYLATARLKGRTSPGGDAALILTFLSGAGGVLGSWMQSLPKGDTLGWRLGALGDRAPAQAAWIGVGIGCSRQAADDWMEADSVELRSGNAAPSA